jgi:hypothetical protein
MHLSYSARHLPVIITGLSKEIGYTLVILPAQKLTEMTMHFTLFHI